MKSADEKLILSQSGVYRLQQLANQVHSATGIRHKLSDQDSLLRLINFSAHCRDTVIQTYLAAFTSELDEEIKDDLANRGILETHH